MQILKLLAGPLDQFFNGNSKPSHIDETDSRPTVLICSTFSKRLSLAPKLYEQIKHFSESGKCFSGENRNNNRIFWRRTDGRLMEHDDWNRLSSVALHLGIGKEGQELVYLITGIAAKLFWHFSALIYC